MFLEDLYKALFGDKAARRATLAGTVIAAGLAAGAVILFTPPEAPQTAPAAERKGTPDLLAPPLAFTDVPAETRPRRSYPKLAVSREGTETAPDTAERDRLAALDARQHRQEHGAGPVTAPPSKAKVEGQPRIAIIIDDMGVDRRRSVSAMKALPAEITLSYLSYGPGIAEQVSAARDDGHEIMLHLGMEPENGDLDPGPGALVAGLPADELRKGVAWSLDQLKGYVGVNNHMGSRFTRDLESMRVVMAELKRRGLFFIDSVTTNETAGPRAAKDLAVPFAARDIFLDHEDDVGFITKQLVQLENRAQKSGLAIAIAHPRDKTLAALKTWLPTLAARGYQLIPASEAIRLRNAAHPDIKAKKSQNQG